MKLKIASNSIDKINGIKMAVSRFFNVNETELEIFHQSVDSGVPEQPFDEETYLGAKNRVKALLNSEDETDLYISCEAGIEEFSGIFFNVQVVCIFDKKTQRYSFGKSTGWMIPTEDIDTIRKTSIDKYLKSRGITCLEDLLGYSRAEEISRATKCALSSLKL